MWPVNSLPPDFVTRLKMTPVKLPYSAGNPMPMIFASSMMLLSTNTHAVPPSGSPTPTPSIW